MVPNLVVAYWRHIGTQIWVNTGSCNSLCNIGSGNSLVPDGTKPLAEPMLIYQQQGPFIWNSFHSNVYMNVQDLKTQVVFKIYTSQLPLPGDIELSGKLL